MSTHWQMLRTIIALLLAAGIFSCLFSLFLPPSAALLAPTPTLTPTITITPTVTPTVTPTSTPIPAWLITPVNEFDGYTVYLKRDLWEDAVGKHFRIEDFEHDITTYRTVDLPYKTGTGLLLYGKSYIEIIRSAQLLQTGNFLHFRDWEQGLTISVPKTKQVTAFGFDYTTPEVWQLRANEVEITIPSGKSSFLGIIFYEGFPREFTLSSSAYFQGGLSMDNISYVP